MYLLITRERIEISKKIPTDSDSAGHNHFSYVKIPKKFGCTDKNNPKLSLLIFRFRVNILKNEKSGIPK
jgi:hypothetical protein